MNYIRHSGFRAMDYLKVHLRRPQISDGQNIYVGAEAMSEPR
jgi:hypothetical protein